MDPQTPAVAASTAFMKACLASELLATAFSEHSRHVCVCQSQLRRAVKRSGADSVNWELEEAEIAKNGVVISESDARFLLADQANGPSVDGRPAPTSGKVGSRRRGAIVSDDGRTLRIGFDDNVFTKLFS